jgi:hypothetical protein
MTITVLPTSEDVPLITEVEGLPADIAARGEAFFKTAAFLSEAGADIDVTEKARVESREIFSGSDQAPEVPSSSAVALHLKALVNEYDHQVLESNIQARQYIVNRLLDISDPRNETKPMEQLKALELLGKVSEIGLFTERVEVNINHKSTEELEMELVKTLSRYINPGKILEDSKNPMLNIDLDEALGRTHKNTEKITEKEEE